MIFFPAITSINTHLDTNFKSVAKICSAQINRAGRYFPGHVGSQQVERVWYVCLCMHAYIHTCRPSNEERKETPPTDQCIFTYKTPLTWRFPPTHEKKNCLIIPYTNLKSQTYHFNFFSTNNWIYITRTLRIFKYNREHKKSRKVLTFSKKAWQQ